jgi:hypothetical protein
VRYGAASCTLRRACGWNSKAAKAEFYQTTKIKFARREGEISFVAKDKILSAKFGADSARDEI